MIIHKFRLMITGNQTLLIKGLQQVLSVTVQKETLVLYAVIDKNDIEEKTVQIALVGTGHHFQLGPSWRFLGTISMADGALMWHVFADQILIRRKKRKQVENERD